MRVGIRMGDSTAPVTLVEFVDLECPACRGFEATLEKVISAHPHELSVVYVPYPLSMHRFALGAARGAECAYHYGRLSQWIDEIFEKQDSLGLKSWGAYARDAGVSDTAAIAQCATDPAPVSRIEAGRALGRKIDIIGTPTVIVNGWRFSNTPTLQELTNAIEATANGKAPTSVHGRPSG